LSEEFKKKIEEFLKRIDSAKTDKECLQRLSEFRTYLTGAVDLETHPIWSNIGYGYIGILRTLEALYSFAMAFNARLSDVEKRIKRIEDELNFREKYK